MTIKTLIAAAAVAAGLTAAAPVQQAEAKTNIDITIGIGDGSYPYGDPTYRRHYYRPAVSCRSGARIVRGNGFWGVTPVDCHLPGYKYLGWRWGHQYLVRVNGAGYITSVNRAY